MIGNEIKLYEFADRDYIVATNLRQAIRCWVSHSDYTIRDALDCFTLISRPMWKKYKFRYDEYDYRSTSFEERIKEVLESGEEKVPFFLASSEY